MRYSFGWYTRKDGQVIVQITEHINQGWFADLFDAKFAAAQFFGKRPVLFQIRRLA
jgi:hypothetical protein